MSLVSLLTTDLTNTLPVLVAEQVQGSVVMRTGSGLHCGELGVHTALLPRPRPPRTRQDLQVDGIGWWSCLLDAVGSEFLHGLRKDGALGQRGSGVEDLPALGAAVLAFAVPFVPVALDASQAVRVPAWERGRVLQGVQANRADKGLLLGPGGHYGGRKGS